MTTRQKNILLIVGVFMVFLLSWVGLAQYLPGWGDEITHMETGKGLALTGNFTPWSYDEGKLAGNIYTRAMIITYMAKWAYQIAGDSFVAFRSISLIFTLILFLTYVWYMNKRQGLTVEQLALAVVLFFIQSFVTLILRD